jgi:ribosomal protein S18 acetylase RimI-like enzyme
MPEIVRLQEADLPATAALLGRAFYNDPLQVYTLPDPEERVLRSPPLFAAALRYGLLYGEVLTNAGTPAGAAVWLGPDAWDITPERAAKAGFERLPEEMGADSTDRFFSALGAVDPYHRAAVPPAHWYLMVIGVAPEAQGTGLARALLQPIFDRADAAGLPCYLETANPANNAFYKHVGFEQVDDVVEPQSGLRLSTFRRFPPG